MLLSELLGYSSIALGAIGSIISVFGVLSAKNSDIREEHTLRCGGNSEGYASSIRAKYDTACGLVYIMIGYIVQFLGCMIEKKYFDFNLADINIILLIFISCLIIIILIIPFIISKRAIKKYSKDFYVE